MNTVQLKSLEIKNFKGIKNASYPFEHETYFRGDNGTGKTSVVDSFMWLMFGKDSQDRKDFDIKTLDKNNQTTDKVNVHVTGVILHNDKEVKLTRELKEKWQKKRGTDSEEFTGNETLYWINDVPTKAGEYSSFIGKIIQEETFKLITNPLYFNTQLSWQDRREVLVKLGGDVSYESLLEEKPVEHILKALSDGKDIEGYKKQLSAERSTLKDELDHIPDRIDELQNSKPVPRLWSKLPDEIKLLEVELKAVNLELSSASEKNKAAQDRVNELYNENQKRIREISGKMNVIEIALKNDCNEFNSNQGKESKELREKISSLRQKVLSTEGDIEHAKQRYDNLTSEKNDLYKEYYKVSDSTFTPDPDKTICPACKRPLDNAKELEKELETNFNNSKVSKLEDIQKKGKDMNEKIDKAEAELNSLNEQLKSINQELSGLEEKEEKLKSIPQQARDYESELKTNKEYQLFVSELKVLKEKEFKAPESSDNTDLLEKQQALLEQISTKKAWMAEKDQTDKINSRIEELESSVKIKAGLMSEIEGKLFDIDNLVKERISRIEEAVNSKFDTIRFKLFKTLINGSEEPTCEALINGVPFSGANTGSQINAGLEVIKTISKFYDVQAPIFIDNRESLTNATPMECQTIHLFKDESYKVLTKTEK